MEQVQMRVSIPNPCGESWNDMVQIRGGRHCETCSKTVHDLSDKNAPQVAEFVRRNPGACIRASVLALQVSAIAAAMGQSADTMKQHGDSITVENLILPSEIAAVAPVYSTNRLKYLSFHINCIDSGMMPEDININLYCGDFHLTFQPDYAGNAALSIPDSITADSIHLVFTGNGFEHRKVVERNPAYYYGINSSNAEFIVSIGASIFECERKFIYIDYPPVIGGIPEINYFRWPVNWEAVYQIAMPDSTLSTIIEPPPAMPDSTRKDVIAIKPHTQKEKAGMHSFGIGLAAIVISLLVALLTRLFLG